MAETDRRYTDDDDTFTGDHADAEELRFLRYFYRHVGSALGPSDSDIRDMIMEDFTLKTGVEVPPAYYPPME